MDDRYFEDYVAGNIERFGPVDIDEEEMVDFARRYDPQPFHIDPVAARGSIYGELIASGWFTCAITMRELVARYLSPSSSLGSPGLESLAWLAPVTAKERYWVSCEILETRPSRSKPDRGILRTRIELESESGTKVLSMITLSMVKRRDPGS